MFNRVNTERPVICAVCRLTKKRVEYKAGFVCTVCTTVENTQKGICDACLTDARSQSVRIDSFATLCPFCRSDWPWLAPRSIIEPIQDISPHSRDNNLSYGTDNDDSIEWEGPYQMAGVDTDAGIHLMSLFVQLLHIQIHRPRVRALCAFCIASLLNHLNIIIGCIIMIMSIQSIAVIRSPGISAIRWSIVLVRLLTAVCFELKFLQNYTHVIESHNLSRLFRTWRCSVYWDGMAVETASACILMYTNVLLYNLFMWEKKRMEWSNDMEPPDFSNWRFASNFRCVALVTFLQFIITFAIHVPIQYISTDKISMIQRVYGIEMRRVLAYRLYDE